VSVCLSVCLYGCLRLFGAIVMVRTRESYYSDRFALLLMSF